jgi:hypothetical protein
MGFLTGLALGAALSGNGMQPNSTAQVLAVADTPRVALCEHVVANGCRMIVRTNEGKVDAGWDVRIEPFELWVRHYGGPTAKVEQIVFYQSSVCTPCALVAWKLP